MKARHIKKLRKRISNFEVYKIRRSAGLFGDFFGNNSLGLIMDDYYITADSYELALKRFFQYFKRAFKRKNESDTNHIHETTCELGRIMVENTNTGYMKFYF